MVRSLLFLLFILSLTGCEMTLPQEPESNEVLAEPFESLSQNQLLLHTAGDADFAKVFSEAEGLGPIFVQISCESCHIGDGKGSPVNSLTRFGRYAPDGITWDPMIDQGGPQLQHRSIRTFEPESLPAGAASSDFIAPNVTGLGYLAAVTDSDILQMADPLDLDGDGISGEVNYITAPEWLRPDPRYHNEQSAGTYIGRFGRKASAIDLLQQTVGAYNQDMGITSEFESKDPINMQSSIFAEDNVEDPEIPTSIVNKVVFYLQTLEAPRRREADDGQVMAGELLFTQIGCESCHTSTLRTGPSEISALNNVEFHPFSDMLLHDMGSELDDSYTEGTVATSEWRTMPLWGLGLQSDSQGGQMFLLHDGRASSYDEAIQFHGGEASNSRATFNGLTEIEKEQIIKFLNSL